MSIPTCKVCSKPNVNVCSGCNRVYYCSVDCQKSDWKTHKVTCKSTKELAEKKDRVLVDALSRVPKFMEVISAIGYLHYDATKKVVVTCSFIEIGKLEWNCDVYLTQNSILNVPEDHYPIRISLAENIANGIDTQLSIGIPYNVCRRNCADIFGTAKHKLPLKLRVSQNSVTVSDSTGRMLIIR